MTLMAQQICQNCNRLFDKGDVVKALIITKFVPLKSSVVYALEKPTECLEVYHQNCNYPKGHEGD